MPKKMKRTEILELCASNPEAIVSYIENLESRKHNRLLALCASNPEAIVSYIESMEPRYILGFNPFPDPPKRPDRSLNFYKRTQGFEIVGRTYNDYKGGDPLWPLNAYAHGYLNAAQKLVKALKREIIVTGKEDIHTLGYPIFFLFEHYLELKMKEIIHRNGYLISLDKYKDKRGHDVTSSHNLTNLWTACEEVLNKIEQEEGVSDLSEDTQMEFRTNYETISYFIKLIEQDKMAQAFRYPNDNMNKPFLVNTPHMILNISVLSDVMDWLSYMLDGISTGVDEYRAERGRYKAEISRE
ncbi:hypothetical protein [Methanosarcina sp.]|uniref:hypothetical protein n=1 Tax=Methanosarcina sp. TaxID=2213 RepID=UPI003C767DE4